VNRPTKKGDPITAGVLLRFVPNWPTHWEYDLHRPSPRAFRRRANEEYVSAYLDGLTSPDALGALFPGFAICALRVEVILTKDGLSVVYWPEPQEPEGIAHVAIYGVNRGRAEWLAREVATIVKEPGPPAYPKNRDERDDPSSDLSTRGA
jgi:hypothetical protein